MLLKTRDYTVWTDSSDGKNRYFIKYHGQTDMPDCEIGFDVFMLYVGEFYRPLEKQRNERRRHLNGGEIDRLVEAGLSGSSSYQEEDGLIIKYTMEAVLKMCTPIQQRRFNLYYHEGYSFVDIAEMENCDAAVVRRSILAVKKKIKNIF